ncbi:MAG: hypothetical protein ACRDFX_07795 [Chloroflexota bacterium]
MRARTIFIIAITISAAAGALAAVHGQAGATTPASSTRGQADPRALPMGAAQAPAALSSARAIDIARSDG